MQPTPGIEAVQLVLKHFAESRRLLSTGAEVVDFSGDLYNVTGSTNDPAAIPRHTDEAWKRLLISMAGLASDTSCYVTNVLATRGSSHPKFSVGGHMTTDPDGTVGEGGSCYLMPLCKWHNSTARDGQRFEHSKTRMLKLTGYMQGELAATFALRQPSHEPFALLMFDPTDKQWKYKNLSKHDLHSGESPSVNRDQVANNLTVLFERSTSGKPHLLVKESTIPE